MITYYRWIRQRVTRSSLLATLRAHIELEGIDCGYLEYTGWISVHKCLLCNALIPSQYEEKSLTHRCDKDISSLTTLITKLDITANEWQDLYLGTNKELA